MNLDLYRVTAAPDYTLGQLNVNGQAECVTLELPVRDGLPGSAIPDGTYPVVLAPSPKFEASTDPWIQNYASQMPHVIHIPNRTLIMIHWGNVEADTDGCILVGQRAETGFIANSRLAFAALFVKIQAGIRAGGCSITVGASE
jgi:Family of unknown function (DUF5675)